MIEELVRHINNLEHITEYLGTTYSSVLLPEPAVGSSSRQCKRHASSCGDIRFPWIHNKDPVAFHFLNMPLSKNHLAVPS